jgi:hypothetical protein
MKKLVGSIFLLIEFELINNLFRSNEGNWMEMSLGLIIFESTDNLFC